MYFLPFNVLPLLIVFLFSLFFRFHDLMPIIILRIIFSSAIHFLFQNYSMNSPFLFIKLTVPQLWLQYWIKDPKSFRNVSHIYYNVNRMLSHLSAASPLFWHFPNSSTLFSITMLCQLIKMVNKRCLWKTFPVSFRFVVRFFFFYNWFFSPNSVPFKMLHCQKET